uniref:Uncharacterized protein n=1 Tax=Rhipicephalus zambeziensis TaxID=60191 RepID=A0A224YH87_9ACAR
MCVQNMNISHKGSPVVPAHRVKEHTACTKKVYHQGSSHFCCYAFYTEMKENQYTDIKPSQGTINKGHSKLTSQHTSPLELCTLTPTAAVSFTVFTGMYLLLPHEKKKKKKKRNSKCALKVCSTSNGLQRYTLEMRKCMKLIQRLMMPLLPSMPINAFGKNHA